MSEEEIQMIRTDAAMSGRLFKPDIWVGVILFDINPQPFQPARIDASLSDYRQRGLRSEKRAMWQIVVSVSLPHEAVTFREGLGTIN
jgi:hypothetical protein